LSDNLQFVITGLSTGAVYALVGLGIVLVHQVTGIINFAQGDFVMLGGLSFALFEEAGLALVPAAMLAITIATVVGVLVNLLAIRPARHASTERLIILTIGASITIQASRSSSSGHPPTSPVPSPRASRSGSPGR
jgi:branched-chain amino acid transport system permease protein